MIIKFTKSAAKDISKMDVPIATGIVRFLEEHIAALSDPRSEGRALTGKWRDFWRYRYGKYRIICDIVDRELTIIVIKTEKRDSVYK